MPLALLPAAAFGLIIGSFLNVVAHRLPGAHVARRLPGSHCPSCETPIKPYDNIPRAVLAAAARALSQLLGADRRALPARRGAARRRCSPPSSPSTTTTPPTLVLGLVLVAFLVPIALIDLDLPDHPQPAHAAGRDPRRSCSAPRLIRAARSSG